MVTSFKPKGEGANEAATKIRARLSAILREGVTTGTFVRVGRYYSVSPVASSSLRRKVGGVKRLSIDRIQSNLAKSTSFSPNVSRKSILPNRSSSRRVSGQRGGTRSSTRTTATAPTGKVNTSRKSIQTSRPSIQSPRTPRTRKRKLSTSGSAQSPNTSCSTRQTRQSLIRTPTTRSHIDSLTPISEGDPDESSPHVKRRVTYSRTCKGGVSYR